MRKVRYIRRPANASLRLRTGVHIWGLILILLSSYMPEHVSADTGDLDPTFGIGGRVTTDIGYNDEAFGVAMQSDGKIIAAGVAVGLGPSDFAIIRDNTNGELDHSFGRGGLVTTAFDVGSVAYDLAIAPDGKIVAIGAAFSNISDGVDFALARYNIDASLDLTFGSGGKVTTDFFDSPDRAFAVAKQSDGKIVLGGVAGNVTPPGIDFALARYNQDGSLDSSFGTSGRVTTDFSGDVDFLGDIVVQSDGNIVAAGSARKRDAINPFDFALVRYTTQGTLDPTFGVGGKLVTEFGLTLGAAAVALQSDGKIIAAGDTFSPVTGGDFAVARYTTDGSLDQTFGTGGRVTTDILGSADQALTVSILPNDKIAVGGRALPLSGCQDFAIARYNSDGSSDSAFGSGGKVATDFSGRADTLNDLTIQVDGKIVGVGGSLGDFALARYKDDSPPFDICIQDESNSSILSFNSSSGVYQFTKCVGGVVISGAASLTRKGNTLTLQHYANDRRVLAKIDISSRKASASIQVFSLGITYYIFDRDIGDNRCSCH